MPKQSMPAQIFPSILDVAKPFKGILLDAYGVFWNGNNVGFLPGSLETMEKLVKAGKTVGILSNSTQLASKELDKLRTHGLVDDKHFHFMTTSGEVAKHIFHNDQLPFNTPKKKFWLFGGMHPRLSPHHAIFKDTPYAETQNLHEADFIYISIPHINGEDQTDPNTFCEGVKELKKMSNIPMVCANPDRFAHEGNPPKAVVRQGSIAAMYEELGGLVFYIGKPSSIVYKDAMKSFLKYEISQPSEVLMVGDTPETDIRGAKNFGMPSALVTQTGIMADRISHLGFEKAVRSFSTNDFPNFFIERLADHGNK